MELCMVLLFSLTPIILAGCALNPRIGGAPAVQYHAHAYGEWHSGPLEWAPREAPDDSGHRTGVRTMRPCELETGECSAC